MENEIQQEFVPLTPKQEAKLGELLENPGLYVMDNYTIVDLMKSSRLSKRQAWVLIGVMVSFLRFREEFSKESVLAIKTDLIPPYRK